MITNALRRLSLLERQLRIATDQPVDEVLPNLVVTEAPALLRVASVRRARHADELRTLAGREAHIALQERWEPTIVGAIAAARQARQTVAADENLSASGKAQQLAALTKSVYGSIRETATHVLGSARHAARIESQILGAARVRESKLSAWEVASELDVRQQLLAMSESERNRALVLAIQHGDLAVLHAALSQPTALGDACGTTNLTNRERIEEAYVRAVMPERSRDLDEVKAVTSAAADALQFGVHLLARETSTTPPDFIQVPIACLTAAAFTTYSEQELGALSVEAARAGESTREHMHRRAVELGHIAPEPATV